MKSTRIQDQHLKVSKLQKLDAEGIIIIFIPELPKNLKNL